MDTRRPQTSFSFKAPHLSPQLSAFAVRRLNSPLRRVTARRAGVCETGHTGGALNRADSVRSCRKASSSGAVLPGSVDSPALLNSAHDWTPSIGVLFLVLIHGFRNGLDDVEARPQWLARSPQRLAGSFRATAPRSVTTDSRRDLIQKTMQRRLAASPVPLRLAPALHKPSWTLTFSHRKQDVIESNGAPRWRSTRFTSLGRGARQQVADFLIPGS